MSDEQIFQLDRLGKALDTSGNTIKSLEKKLVDAKQIISILEQEKKQWEQQKVIQDSIIKQQLSSSDAQMRILQEEIIALKARLQAV